MNPCQGFPERLRAARALRGLEQTALAMRTALPPSSISHFETGTRKPSFDNLRRLADGLDVSVDYFMGLSDTPGQSRRTDALYTSIQSLTAEERQLVHDFVALLQRRRESKTP